MYLDLVNGMCTCVGDVKEMHEWKLLKALETEMFGRVDCHGIAQVGNNNFNS